MIVIKSGILLRRAENGDEFDFAKQSADLGYDCLWLGELWGTNSLVRLAEIAARLENIQIGTSIVNVFSRSPAVLAMAGATLNRIADGGFRMGLGTSTDRAISSLHGMTFEQPLQRTRETVELVKGFTSKGEGRVNYSGEIFNVSNIPPLGIDVPVFNAALGPANRRLTGELCDGWIPHNIPFSRLDPSFETIVEAAGEHGRDASEFTVTPYVPSAVSSDRDEARDLLRAHVAYYVGNGEGYRNAVGAVYPDEAEEVAEHWAAGDRSEAAASVTDDMVDDLGIAGTPEEARDRLEDLVNDTCIDEPIVVIPRQADASTARETQVELSPSAG